MAEITADILQQQIKSDQAALAKHQAAVVHQQQMAIKVGARIEYCTHLLGVLAEREPVPEETDETPS